MSRATVLQRVQDLATAQPDAIAIDKFYDHVVADLGRGEWLLTATLVAVTAGTSEYTPPSTVLDIKHVFYDDRVLYKESLRALESVNPSWRDERGTPYAYVGVDETNKDFRLYPNPDRASKPVIPVHGAPFGWDYPAGTVVIIATEFRENLPPWLEMPVAYDILSREFGRESDHKDRKFADLCDKMSKLLMKMVGP